MSRCYVSSAGQALQLLPQKLTFCCTQYLSFWGQSPTSIHVAVMASACLRASPVSDCIHSRSGTAKTKAGVYLAWLMTFSRFMPTPHSGRWPQAISGFTLGKNRQSPRRVDFVSAPRPATVNFSRAHADYRGFATSIAWVLMFGGPQPITCCDTIAMCPSNLIVID